MKKQFIALLIIFMSSQILAQDKILIADRDIHPKKDAPIHLIYGVHKNDKIILTLSTKKDKPIEKISVALNGTSLYSGTSINPANTIEFTIPETNFLHLYFYNKKDISVKIERIPSAGDTTIFNPFIFKYKNYDTSYVEYEIDSVVGYDEIHTPKYFRVIASADYESIKLYEKKLTISGGDAKGILITKPKELIKTVDKEMKLIGYQITITSAAGASAMWDAIASGVDIGTMCLSLVLPAGGTAAGLGIETAFEMIGPQEGGEPVYYAIMGNQQNLDYFTSKDLNVVKKARAYEFGLATGYNATWAKMDTLAIGLKNLNIAVEVEVSVVVSAIYQSTIWENISQDIITVKPKIVRVKRTRQVIKKNIEWDFETN